MSEPASPLVHDVHDGSDVEILSPCVLIQKYLHEVGLDLGQSALMLSEWEGNRWPDVK